jgi:hypothetical protein
MSLSVLEQFVAALQTERGSVVSLSALEQFVSALRTQRGSIMSLSALELFVAALQNERGSVHSTQKQSLSSSFPYDSSIRKLDLSFLNFRDFFLLPLNSLLC